MHCGWLGPILGSTAQKIRGVRHEPARRRTRFSLHPLAARPPERPLAVARPLLHRRRLGRHAVAPGHQSGQRCGTGEGARALHRRSHPGGRGRRTRVPGLGQADRQTAVEHPAKMVRTDHRQSRGPRADPRRQSRASRWRKRWAKSISAAPMSNSSPRRPAASMARPSRPSGRMRACSRSSSRSASAAPSRRGIFRAL